MRRSNYAVLLLTGMCGLSPAAQEMPERQPEEIVVTGELTPARLRFQLERAQEDVYQLFNELLDDTEYRINCVSRSSTSSHIVRRSCEPAFLADARARVAAQTMSTWRSGPEDRQLAMEMALSTGRVSDSDLQFDNAQKYEKMNQAMFDLAMENPQLQKALLRLAALQHTYLALTEQQQKKVEETKTSTRSRLGCLFRKCQTDAPQAPP